MINNYDYNTNISQESFENAGNKQAQASQNVYEENAKPFRSGADMLKELWSKNKGQAVVNTIGNVIGGLANGTNEWTKNRDAYLKTLQNAASQAAEDTSRNINTANLAEGERAEAINKLNQEIDVGKNLTAEDIANASTAQQVLGEADPLKQLATSLISDAVGIGGQVVDKIKENTAEPSQTTIPQAEETPIVENKENTNKAPTHASVVESLVTKKKPKEYWDSLVTKARTSKLNLTSAEKKDLEKYTKAGGVIDAN